MPKTIIQLKDETLVEVEVNEDEIEAVAGGITKYIDSSFDKIRPLIIKTCLPVLEAWQHLSDEISEKDKSIGIDGAEIEIGLSFEGEGNVYITKLNSGANLVVKLLLRSKS